MGRATDAEGRLMSAAAAVEAQEAALRDALVQAMADAEEAAAAGSGSGADPAAEEATEREEAGSDLNGAISTSSGLRQPSRVRVPNAHAHALSAAAAAALAGGVSAVLAAFEEQRARLEARIAAAEAAVSAKEAEAAGLQVWEREGWHWHWHSAAAHLLRPRRSLVQDQVRVLLDGASEQQQQQHGPHRGGGGGVPAAAAAGVQRRLADAQAELATLRAAAQRMREHANATGSSAAAAARMAAELQVRGRKGRSMMGGKDSLTEPAASHVARLPRQRACERSTRRLSPRGRCRCGLAGVQQTFFPSITAFHLLSPPIIKIRTPRPLRARSLLRQTARRPASARRSGVRRS